MVITEVLGVFEGLFCGRGGGWLGFEEMDGILKVNNG